jgi:CO dehydrogenase nickel-insertion accessory protein CooC1
MAKAANGTAGGAGHGGAIHLTLQGKGGKSLIASVLAQYFQRKGVAVRCVDTDPVNRTLAIGALG